jgi:4-hydroxy-tetrahydrodipicolinate reductase
MELVGVLVHSEDKEGRDAGEVVGIAPIGITTTRNIEDIIALKPDAAIWSAQGYDPESIARLLAAGINVYTGLGGYFLEDLPEREMLEAACNAGGASLAAGGNIPGLISDVFPIFLTGFTGNVQHITAHQRNHVSHYPSAIQLSYGLGLGQPEGSGDSEAELDGFWEWLMAISARMVASALNITFSELRTRSKEKQLAPRTETLPGSGLVIDAGTVAGVRWTWDAYSGDRCFLTIINEQTGVYGLGDSWRQDESEPAWSVELDASPPLIGTLTWPEGLPAATGNSQLNAARAINFLPALVAAPAGCRSILDLPMITCSDVQP